MILHNNNGSLEMSEFNTELSVESIQSKIEGLFDDDTLGKLYNKMLENLLPGAVKTTDFSQYVSSLVIPHANIVLRSIRLDDLIFGKGVFNVVVERCDPK